MDPLEYENINQVNDLIFLATPTITVQPTDRLYLSVDGTMTYLGTLSDARNRSFNSDAPGYDIIGIDGTNYGDINDPEINKNFYILKPSITVVPGKSAKKNPPGERKKGGKTKYRRSHCRKSYRRKSRRRKSHYKRSRHR